MKIPTLNKRNKILLVLAVLFGLSPISLGGYFFVSEPDTPLLKSRQGVEESVMPISTYEEKKVSLELILTAVGTVNSIALGWAGFFFNRREKQNKDKG